MVYSKLAMLTLFYKHIYYIRAVFRAHRRALKNNVEHSASLIRDPSPPNADGNGDESATEDDDVM
jgi:hypothetical protein